MARNVLKIDRQLKLAKALEELWPEIEADCRMTQPMVAAKLSEKLGFDVTVSQMRRIWCEGMEIEMWPHQGRASDNGGGNQYSEMRKELDDLAELTARLIRSVNCLCEELGCDEFQVDAEDFESNGEAEQ